LDEVLIVTSAAHHFLLSMREALAIWFALTALAAIGLVSVFAPVRRNRPARAQSHATGTQHHRARLAEQAQEMHRYAEEIAVVAKRAAVTAQRKRAEWAAAQRTEDAAWRTYQTADRAAREVIQATAFPAPQIPVTPGELEARRRYLRRAATAAHQRGELSARQLVDVLFECNGWDPRRHPYDQEAILRRLGRDQLHRAYQAASAIERTAWHSATIASLAKQSLDNEAYAAAQRAREAQTRLTTHTPHGLSTRIARWPSPVTR
jgi:hypothetical protein